MGSISRQAEMRAILVPGGEEETRGRDMEGGGLSERREESLMGDKRSKWQRRWNGKQAYAAKGVTGVWRFQKLL